jgi:hypothetical protein
MLSSSERNGDKKLDMGAAKLPVREENEHNKKSQTKPEST